MLVCPPPKREHTSSRINNERRKQFCRTIVIVRSHRDICTLVYAEAENVLAFPVDLFPSEPLKAYRTSSTRLEIPNLSNIRIR
jgi:hypothetical protein